MKRRSLKLLSCTAAVIVIIAMLNIKVSTKQGVNYKVSTIKIPLYLKVLDFFDRHYNYQLIVKNIAGDVSDEKGKILRIFEWTHENIRKTPEGCPVIDDHVWNIIVRGYGQDDQSSDVFTTLCNYAGAEAFYSWVDSGKNDRYLVLSFVRIKGRWNVFDPYNGVYFKNDKGELADTKEILSGNWHIEKTGSPGTPDIDYGEYLPKLKFTGNIGFSRANTQSPANRLKYEIKKLLR